MKFNAVVILIICYTYTIETGYKGSMSFAPEEIFLMHKYPTKIYSGGTYIGALIYLL